MGKHHMTQIGIIVVVMCFGVAMTTAQDCHFDHECPVPNTYCYKTGVCAECIDCSLYHRYPGKGCARDKHQCGTCLPGMEAETNIDKTLSVCQRIKSPTTIADDDDDDVAVIPEHTSHYIIVCSTVVIVAAIVAVTLYVVAKYTDYDCPSQIVRGWLARVCPRRLMGDENAQPPPQHFPEKSATAPPYEAPPPPLDPPIYSVHPQIVNDPSQRANYFEGPIYARKVHLDSNPNPDPTSDEQAESENLLNNNISQHDDEATQPSTWTPEINSTAMIPTSFSNMLNLQNLSITQPDGAQRLSGQHSTNSRTGSDVSIHIPHNSSGNSEPPNSPNSSVPQFNVNIDVCISNNSHVHK